jgi:hypothetical protein
MDALRGYGSSDDNNSNDDDEKVEKSVPVLTNGKEIQNNGTSEDLSVPSATKLSSSLVLKVCSAPEVVATVSL